MRFVKSGLAGLTGLILYLGVFQLPLARAVVSKSLGGDQPCPWSNLWTYPWQLEDFVRIKSEIAGTIKLIQEDKPLRIAQYGTSERPFWMKTAGDTFDGPALLTYILTEQRWLAEALPGHGVRPGDVVVDVGAHVGTFGADALRLGASKVVMIEPDPTNVECIRRNFAAEIGDGRVILIPEGAWSSTGTLDFRIGDVNSGTGSLVLKDAGSEIIHVPVARLDDLLARAGITKVDFMKMDIEGAEREALKGAAQMLKESKPRLMLDMYHLEDDPQVLPAIIVSINPAYRSFCPACGIHTHVEDPRIIPYATFWE